VKDIYNSLANYMAKFFIPSYASIWKEIVGAQFIEKTSNFMVTFTSNDMHVKYYQNYFLHNL